MDLPPEGAPDDLTPEGVLSDLPPDGALNVLPPEGAPEDLPPDGALNVLPPCGALKDLAPEGDLNVLPPDGGRNDLLPEGGLILFRLKIDLELFLTPGERKCPVLGAPIPANVLPWNRSTGSILWTL